MTRPEFTFPRHPQSGLRWGVMLGNVLCGYLAWHPRHRPPGPAPSQWRLRAAGDDGPPDAVWQRGETRPPRSVPDWLKRAAIEQIAAWTLDSLAEAAQANSLLRARLESATAKLAAERDILRESLLTEDGAYDDEADIELVAEFDREIEANRAALARVRVDKEESA